MRSTLSMLVFAGVVAISTVLGGCGSSDESGGTPAAQMTSDPAGVYDLAGTGWTLEANNAPEGGRDVWTSPSGLILSIAYFDANGRSAHDLCDDNYTETLAQIEPGDVLFTPEALAGGSYWWGWYESYGPDNVYDAFYANSVRGLAAETFGAYLTTDQARNVLVLVHLR